jgi:hypothetical protein
MQCQFETCGDRHVLVSALKLVGGAKCQFEDLFVYHAKTTNINQVAFIEIVS